MTKSRILIVDDDSKVSNLEALILNRAGGYEVLEENRSHRAIQTALEFMPDLFILDVDMPGKDGGELAAEIARHPRLSHVPVLFITSLVAGRESNKSFVKCSEQFFLAKPVLPSLLLRSVGEMLECGQLGVAAVS
jgi:CheY-like chemotaxis protein